MVPGHGGGGGGDGGPKCPRPGGVTNGDLFQCSSQKLPSPTKAAKAAFHVDPRWAAGVET